MELWKSWVIATKDFNIFFKKKRILYTLLILPLLLSIVFPLTVKSLTSLDNITTEIITLLNAFSYFYIILVYIQSTTLASYSILGEKIEESLEPLLATPTTDSEILLGKTIASFIPSIVIIYLTSIIFMLLSDLFTYNTLGYIFFPNLSMGFILLFAVPLSSLLSIQLNVIISSRVNDIRTANQLGFLIFLPFMGIYILLVTNAILLNIINLLIISTFLLVINIILFYLSKAIFNRDKILTKWK